ncbi:MAG: hypothetical protein ACTS6G_03665, partial [Candidatus Hodgkinia cicadicola]
MNRLKLQNERKNRHIDEMKSIMFGFSEVEEIKFCNTSILLINMLNQVGAEDWVKSLVKAPNLEEMVLTKSEVNIDLTEFAMETKVLTYRT